MCIRDSRNIVTEIAGTTRDSIYTRYDKFGFDFYLVDTAGLRRKNKVSEDLEFYSGMRSIRAIENSCLLYTSDPQCSSAATGGGTGDLLDMILDKLQDNPEEAIEEDIPRFAVVGRPNAGKRQNPREHLLLLSLSDSPRSKYQSTLSDGHNPIRCGI